MLDINFLWRDKGRQQRPAFNSMRNHCCVGHSGMTMQGRFDFAGLDPKTADFDLLIEPPEKFEIAVRPPPHPVTGSITARAGAFLEWVSDEAIRSLGWLIEVAKRNALAADQRFAGDANGQKLHSAVHYVDSHTRQRLTNGDIERVAAGARTRLVNRRRDSGFGRAISVKKTNSRPNMLA